MKLIIKSDFNHCFPLDKLEELDPDCLVSRSEICLTLPNDYKVTELTEYLSYIGLEDKYIKYDGANLIMELPNE